MVVFLFRELEVIYLVFVFNSFGVIRIFRMFRIFCGFWFCLFVYKEGGVV